MGCFVPVVSWHTPKPWYYRALSHTGKMLMILECLNSACRRPLYYLRAGRIVRTQYQEGTRLKLEHFWLCGDCSQFFDFRVFSDGPAVAIRCGKYSQRFVRTEQAAVITSKEEVKECVNLTTVITQGWHRDSDHSLSGGENAAPQESLRGYLLSKIGVKRSCESTMHPAVSSDTG